MVFFKYFFSACANNVSLRKKFHQGIWNGKRWSCCRLNARNSSGCKDCSTWLNNLVDDKENNKENYKTSKWRFFNCPKKFHKLFF